MTTAAEGAHPISDSGNLAAPLGEGPEWADVQADVEDGTCMVDSCTRPATRTITVQLPAEMFSHYLPPTVRAYIVVVCSGLHPHSRDLTVGVPAGPDRFA